MRCVSLRLAWILIASTLLGTAAVRLPAQEAANSLDEPSRDEVLPLANEPPKGNAGLFIGVNKFDDAGLNQLQFAVNDAVEQAYLFVFTLKLIAPENCFLLLSGEGEPTAPLVREHLRQLRSARAKVTTAKYNDFLEQLLAAQKIGQVPTDLLICSISSHGFNAGITAYVMPSTGLKGFLEKTGFPLQTIEESMDKSKAEKRLLLVDACQQRMQAKNIEIDGPVMNAPVMDAQFREAVEKGIGQYKLVSCSPKELSYESAKLGGVGHGVFTYALLKALRGGAAADDDNMISLASVEDYVTKDVPEWTTSVKFAKQTPFSAGAKDLARKLTLAKKPSDLATLIDKVRKHPLTFEFTEELRQRLVEMLKNLDLKNKEDRAVLDATRRFINGNILPEFFVPYLEKELAKRNRPMLASPPNVARFEVLEGPNHQAAPGAFVELRWRAAGAKQSELVRSGTTDGKGLLRIPLATAVLLQGPGQYLAVAMKGRERSGETPLADFPGQGPWKLELHPPPGQAPVAGEPYVNSLGMKLAYIPPGKFLMGSPESEDGRFNDEFQHEVEITRGFNIGAYEVTQSEYQQVTGMNPSHFSPMGDGKAQVDGQDTSRFPVENVNWNDAVEFCRRLSEIPAEKAAGRSYRLPTEAEWEYACRSGTTKPFHLGGKPAEKIELEQANFGPDEGWNGKAGPWLARTARAGSYAPNDWGLFDMHGNVWEHCSDFHNQAYYKNSPPKDPAGPDAGLNRVRRGGSWYNPARYCRAASLRWGPPDERPNPPGDPDPNLFHLGFRVVLTLSK